MRRRMKRITAILLSLSTALSCAANAWAAQVNLGDIYRFPAVPYVNPGVGDASETIDKLYTEARGAATTSSYDMNSMESGYKIPDGGWDWADWTNSNAWRDPVENQGPMGTPQSPNGSMPDELSNPGAAHAAITSNMPTIPNTAEAFQRLIDDMSGGKQTGVMSLEDFMKLVGDHNKEIKEKYNALIKEAKKKQKGDAESAKDIQRKFEDAQNGTNPWTGQTNHFPTQSEFWDQYESWKNDDDNEVDETVDDGSSSDEDEGGDPSMADVESQFDWFLKALYRDAVAGGFHEEVPKERVSWDDAKDMRYIYGGQTMDENGEPTGSAAELVAKGSDEYTYFYRDKNGNLVSMSKDFLIDRYGSMEAAEKFLGPLTPAGDFLKGGKTVSDLTEEERAAFRRAGLTIKDTDGKFLTPAQIMDKYGNYDAMPQSVQDAFDQNRFLRDSLNKMYGEEIPYVMSVQDFFAGFEDADFNSSDFPEYPDYSDLTAESKAFFKDLGIDYDKFKTFVEDSGGMKNLSLADVQTQLAETAEGVGEGKRKIFNTDEAFFEDPLLLGYGNLGQAIYSANGNFDNLPDVMRQRMTKTQFEELSKLHPSEMETLKASDIHWVPVRTSTMGQAGWDKTDTLQDCWYQCPHCGGFFNTRYACGCGIFNNAEWAQHVREWDRGKVQGQIRVGDGGRIGDLLEFLDATISNDYISEKLPNGFFSKDRRREMLLAMNPASDVVGLASYDNNGRNGLSFIDSGLDENGNPASVMNHQWKPTDDGTAWWTNSTERVWNIYNPCRMLPDKGFEGLDLEDIDDPAGVLDQIEDMDLEDELGDLVDWLNDQLGGDAGNGVDGSGDNGRAESESQSKKFDDESEKQSKKHDDDVARLESEKQAALDAYRRQIQSEYEEYLKRHPNKEDALPKDPDLWTDEDLDKAVEDLNNEVEQATGAPKFDESKIPKIGDTKEYSETDLEKLAEEIFGGWPSNQGSMDKFYEWLVSKYGADGGSDFVKTLRAMYEAGVFDSDDPDIVRKNMRAFINGYEALPDGGTGVLGFAKVFTEVNGHIEGRDVKRSSRLAVGNQRYEITYENPREVATARLMGGDRDWCAGPVTGNYVAVGKYDQATEYYTLAMGYVEITQYAEALGLRVEIRSRSESVVIEDLSGIKRENVTEKTFYGPETIKVVPGDIDMNKTDFFNTKRIR